MPSITDVLRPFGNARAVDNVNAMLAAREREDWLVAGLVLRLDQAAPTPERRTAAA
ncbi:MAG: hypothetical protein ACT4OV_10795 [Microthrixaceae bacterium]